MPGRSFAALERVRSKADGRQPFFSRGVDLATLDLPFSSRSSLFAAEGSVRPIVPGLRARFNPPTCWVEQNTNLVKENLDRRISKMIRAGGAGGNTLGTRRRFANRDANCHRYSLRELPPILTDSRLWMLQRLFRSRR